MSFEFAACPEPVYHCLGRLFRAHPNWPVSAAAGHLLIVRIPSYHWHGGSSAGLVSRSSTWASFPAGCGH